jgi:hypothetical protein
MTQQPSEQRGARCLLCINQVKLQGDVCPQCEPEYITIGKVLIDYADQLEPSLKASPYKHICAAMRFVLDSLFFLEELPTPLPYGDKMITHRLTLMEITPDKENPLRVERWYGHNIPSAFMASTINPGGFPRDPFYFVPIANWKPVSHPGAKLEHNEATGGGSDGQH